MSDKLKVGLLGYGTIGCGVIKLLTQSNLEVEELIELKKVADKDLERKRPVRLDPSLLTDDAESVIRDPDIDVIVELIGGVGAAKQFVEMALDEGKDVVTANKYLMSIYGDELSTRASKTGSRLLFEASVAGGVPILQTLREELAADRVRSISAILNGTCNYILTRLEENPGMTTAAVVAEAQEKGFAEADPTLDVSGMDSAQKIAILIRKAFLTRIKPDEIDVQGITDVRNIDVQSAREMGYRIKLLARAHRVGDKLEVWVGPTLIPAQSILAQVRNEFNAISIDSEAHHEQMFIGKGAGMMPTAGAVVGDLYTLSNHKNIPAVFDRPMLNLTVLDRKEIPCRYYLRLTVKDSPGVLASVSKTLADHGISIASVVQRELSPDEYTGVPLTIITHGTTVGDMIETVQELDRNSFVLEPAHTLRIMDSF